MTAFDVKIVDTLYALVRDPAHVHPPELHAHLGTTGEAGIRRVLDAVEADDWFDGEGHEAPSPTHLNATLAAGDEL